MRPKVLVLLAAFNGSKWIVAQIESILNQTGVDLDLVVSDDGSTDNTLAQVEQFAQDERVRVISPPAPTGSAAQNFLWLIRDTSVDGYAFVALADQDDIWHKEKLAHACSMLTDRRADGYSCAVTAFWNDGYETILRQVDVLTKSDFLFEGAGQGSTFVLSVSFYLRLRVFLRQHVRQTESLHYHDWAIYALSRSWRLVWIFDQASMMRYRQHGYNDTGARTSVEGILRRFRLIRCGWYLRQLLAIAQICIVAAPADFAIKEWQRLLALPRGFIRNFQIARFCIKGGRRRLADNTILVGVAIAGWI